MNKFQYIIVVCLCQYLLLQGQFERLTFVIEGTPLLLDQNTVIKKSVNDEYMLIEADSLDHFMKQLLASLGAKIQNIIIKKMGLSIEIITTFTTIKADKKIVPKRIYNNCMGYRTLEDGMQEYYCKGSACEIIGYELTTQGNRVGIDENDLCYISLDKKTVHTVSGKIFSHIKARESSLTGTPGAFSCGGYIGYMVLRLSNAKFMGSGKRIDFFDASV